MKSFQKLLLFLWKNWILRKRHYVVSIIEIILPTLLSILLVVLHSKGGEVYEVNYISQPIIYPLQPLNGSISGNNRSYTLYYAPKNTILNTMMNIVQSLSSQTGLILQLIGVDNEDSIIDANIKSYSSNDSNFLGGIVFIDQFPNSTGIPRNLNYQLRFQTQFNTSYLRPEYHSSGPLNDTGFNYFESHFLVVQHLIAVSYIQIITRYNDLFSKIQINTKRFPYPPYYNDAGINQLLENNLPLFVVLSFLFTIPSISKSLVREKEKGIKELTQMMGLSPLIQWIGWFLSNFVIMSISIAIIIIFLCFPIGSAIAIIHYSSAEVIFFLFLLYIASAIMFCFFISSFFIQPTIAGGATAILWLLSYSIPFYIFNNKFTEISLFLKLVIALIPNMSLCWMVNLLVGFEGRQIGIHWNNLSTPAIIGDEFTTLHLIGIMCFNIFNYCFLTWYIDNVFPGIYGVPKPWYFLFTKSYWCSSNPSLVQDVYTIPVRQPSEYIEDDPSGLKVGIAIKNLSKRYSRGRKSKYAVDDISLNIYENQITALLGHNGAGKSTTMSILTGMNTPTKGTAIVNGFDIRTQMEQSRESIGLCPQENVLFGELTVKEHLEFFGTLKGMSRKRLNSEVNILMKKLQLEKKSETCASNLSGGMKRKLNLGIALIGDTKIVMLDEPTSGLDPEARRAIWDVLHEMRSGRTILLTTHFMEEADALGDRIAIMSKGKIKCVGSALFLKHKYGDGYHLNILKTENCDENALFSFIKSFVPTVYLRTSTNAELSYILPIDYTAVFPQLFLELQKTLNSLGIINFGISVTTMEEVFLRVEVGKEIETIKGKLTSSNQSISGSTPSILPNNRMNLGVVLVFQQLFGLLMKRWHYSIRRWIILLLQIFTPVVMVAVIFYLNRIIQPIDRSKVEPPLWMDLSSYDKGVVFFESNSDSLGINYRMGLPKGTEIIETKDVESAMLKLADNDLRKYREKCIISAVLSADFQGYVNATAFYSSLFLNSLPISLGQIHQALLQFYTSSTNWNINLQNAPLPKNPEKNNKDVESFIEMKAIGGGIYIPNGLAFLSSSFTVLPIQERTSKMKQLQMMTGVSAMIYWGSSFIWDFILHTITSFGILSVIHFMDVNDLFTSIDALEVQLLLLYLYGLSEIPLAYLMSFLFKLPATGYITMLVFNMLTGSVLSLITYIFQGNESLKSIADIFAWVFSMFPSYNLSLAYLNIAKTSSYNKHCNNFDADVLRLFCPKATVIDSIYPCCPNCEAHCLHKLNYLKWDNPGCAHYVMMLLIDFIFFVFILLLIEKGYATRISYKMKNFKNSKEIMYYNDNTNVAVDTDVLKEKRRIYNLLVAGQLHTDTLIVDELTKKYGNSFLAVDHLSFGVKTGECFGLLGINGAGKTTTFRMLTADEVITEGDAFIHGASLKTQRNKFLKQIGYCPQIHALLDHLTAREILFLFGRLRGLVERQIPSTVRDLIAFVGIENHADKITKVYSGGTKRKLNAAIALMGDPSTILLDEPTNGVDPASRHKFWDILTAVKNSGTSLVLTSHSMDECEALCSRIAIMVNGQFMCIGSPQYLKTKFGVGYTIIAKLDNKLGMEMETYQRNLQIFIESSFNHCQLKDSHYGLVQYHIGDKTTPWTKLFSVMEIAKSKFSLEDYSVSQTTLEQVFLSFARMQRGNSTEETTSF